MPRDIHFKRLTFTVLPIVMLIMLFPYSAFAASNNSQAKLAEARDALKAPQKKLDLANRLLLELIEEHKTDFDSVDLCHIYTYLGYIADHRGKRQEAIKWYEKAASMEGDRLRWIREVAKIGLRQPVTWIRHLDAANSEGARHSNWRNSVIDRIDEGVVVTEQPPRDLKVQQHLSQEDMRANFSILCRAIERYFSFFEHKRIDWPSVKRACEEKVSNSKTAEDFYITMEEFMRELRDSHSWLCNFHSKPPRGQYGPGFETQLVEKQAVVTQVMSRSDAEQAGLRPGAIITAIDSHSVADMIDCLRVQLKVFSSDRGFYDAAYREIPMGERNSECRVTFKASPDAAAQTVALSRTHRRQDKPQPQPFVSMRGEYVWSGQHPSGLGYIRILSFTGRMQVANEFDRALESLREAPALIIDIRDNLGGFGTGQERIVGRFLSQACPVAISFQRSVGASDFISHTTTFAPAGSWQYHKPVVLLLNSRTGSAADLFATYSISTDRPIAVGTTTHGNLTGVGVYAVLPCNLVVRISNGYVCDADGRIIEGQGNQPQVFVEQTISDLAAGRDTALLRAIELLQHEVERTKSSSAEPETGEQDNK